MPKVAALELTDADLKVVLASWNKGEPMVLERAISVELGDLAKDTNGMAMRLSRVRDRLKAQENMPQCDAGILLPKQYCIARRVLFPSSAPEEIAGMVPFEAEKHIPFNREKHVVSHEIVSTGGIEGAEVILAATEESVARNGADFIAAGGFDPLFASVSSLSLVQGFLAQATPDMKNESVVLLQLGQVHTDITVLDKGRVAATRAVMVGLTSLRNMLGEGPTPFSAVDPAVNERLLGEMKNFGVPVAPGRRVSHEQIMRLNLNEPDALTFDMESEDEEEAVETNQFTEVGGTVRAWMHKLASQVRRTCEFAAREATLTPPVRIYIAGEGSMIRGMTEHLKAELGIEAVVFNPLAKMAASPTLPKAEMERLSEFASLHGALIRLHELAELRRSAPARVNLLPADVIARHMAQERNVLLTITGTLALIAAILTFLMIDSNSRYEKAMATSHRQSIAAMEPKVRELKEKERKVRIIQRLRSDRSSALQVLDVVSAYPELGMEMDNGRVTVTDVKYVAEESVNLVGHALSIQDITKLVDYLRSQKTGGKPLFVSVTVKSQPPTTLNGRDVYEYTIGAELDNPSNRRR